MRAFRVGERASLARAFSRGDIEDYAELTGDVGALAGDPIAVPGPLLAGLFSQLLGTTLPGRGTNYLKQQLSFHEPVCVGEEVTAAVEITRIRLEKALIDLATTCAAADGRVLCSDRALVLARDVE